MSRCGFNTFLAVGLLQVPVKFPETEDKIFSAYIQHIQCQTYWAWLQRASGARAEPCESTRDGSITNLKRIPGDFNPILAPFLVISATCALCHWASGVIQQTPDLLRRSTEGLLTEERILLHSPYCRAGTSHIPVALHRGAGASQ